MKVEKQVQEFIRNGKLIADNARVLVALSGGADSVALLRILVKLGYYCHAVHCNFHLRDAESDRDEIFAVELCQSLHIPYEVVHFDTKKYALEKHISIEMAARELRYREFERIREAQGLDVIAVAHHQDDAVETLLLNLIRGAGINGLTGMRTINGYIVRPLLCITREEVIDYLHHLKQPYVTDSTNLTDEYARNKVRLNLLPLMQQINPAAKDNILQAALHLADAAALYNKVIEEKSLHIVEGKEEPNISISALLDTDTPRSILFEILHPYGFNSAQVNDIFRSLSSEAGRIFHTKKYIVLRDRTHLLVRRKDITEETCDALYHLPDDGTLVLPDGTTLIVRHVLPDTNWQVPRCNDILCIDPNRFVGPLTLRHPKDSDRFRPFGMKGSKLLSDFYTDIKLPRTEKSQQWLLCHGDDILWSVGKRSSELCRLRGKEQCVIYIECIKKA
jgi:tRNA(Ile)-lysidine synthase